jgi:hypothetical protein
MPREGVKQGKSSNGAVARRVSRVLSEAGPVENLAAVEFENILREFFRFTIA